MAEEKEKYPWDDENEKTEDEAEETAGAKIVSWVKNHKKLVGFTVAAGAGAIFLWRVIKSIPDVPDAGDELMNTLDDPYDPFKDKVKNASTSPDANDILEIKKRLAALENDASYSKRLNELEANIGALRNQQVQKLPTVIDTRTFYRMKYPDIPEGGSFKADKFMNNITCPYWISDNIVNVACDAGKNGADFSLSSDIAMSAAADMMSEIIKKVDLDDIKLVQMMVDLKERD